jgi:hypothetical protein
MKTYGWWNHYGVPAPEPLPTRFWDGGGAAATLGIDPTSPDYPRSYYTTVAALLSLVRPTSVVHDLYVMRALSAFFGMLTLWVAWRGACESLGERGGPTVGALLALHPQFAVASTTASPDALVNLFGAVVWWQIALGLRRGRIGPALVGMWAAAVLAAAVDRMGTPLLVASLIATVLVLWRRPPPMRWMMTGVVVVAALTTSFWLLTALPRVLPDALATSIVPLQEARDWDYLSRFSSGFIVSWWSSLGWVRYSPPSWWTPVAVALTVIVAAGVVRLLFTREGRNAVVVMAVAMVIVQTAAVYWAYYRLGQGGQGRYLFPCLIPTLVLLWLGIKVWVPERHWRVTAVGLFALFALLNVVMWETVAVRAYVM